MQGESVSIAPPKRPGGNGVVAAPPPGPARTLAQAIAERLHADGHRWREKGVPWEATSEGYRLARVEESEQIVSVLAGLPDGWKTELANQLELS